MKRKIIYAVLILVIIAGLIKLYNNWTSHVEVVVEVRLLNSENMELKDSVAQAAQRIETYKDSFLYYKNLPRDTVRETTKEYIQDDAHLLYIISNLREDLIKAKEKENYWRGQVQFMVEAQKSRARFDDSIYKATGRKSGLK